MLKLCLKYTKHFELHSVASGNNCTVMGRQGHQAFSAGLNNYQDHLVLIYFSKNVY